MKCIICNSESDGHHVKSRGAGGTDDSWNVVALCRGHHVEVHKLGRTEFAKRYGAFNYWLLDNGWELIGNKWYRDKDK
jgi:hypothetical protein